MQARCAARQPVNKRLTRSAAAAAETQVLIGLAAPVVEAPRASGEWRPQLITRQVCARGRIGPLVEPWRSRAGIFSVVFAAFLKIDTIYFSAETEQKKCHLPQRQQNRYLDTPLLCKNRYGKMRIDTGSCQIDTNRFVRNTLSLKIDTFLDKSRTWIRSAIFLDINRYGK